MISNNTQFNILLPLSSPGIIIFLLYPFFAWYPVRPRVIAFRAEISFVLVLLVLTRGVCSSKTRNASLFVISREGHSRKMWSSMMMSWRWKGDEKEARARVKHFLLIKWCHNCLAFNILWMPNCRFVRMIQSRFYSHNNLADPFALGGWILCASENP